MPSAEAKALAVAALVAYATAALLPVVGRRLQRRFTGPAGAILLAGGLGLSLAALAIRLARGHAPTASGFDTFVLLALLGGAAAAYFRAVSALPAAEAGLLLLATACSVLAVALSGSAYRDFARDVWNVAHVVLAVSAAVSFAAAAGAGWLYVRKHKHLRSKDAEVLNSRTPSLERLGRFVRHVLPVSFALITGTIVTGAVGAFQPQRTGYLLNWWMHPKVLFAVITWCIYTVALHAVYARRARVRAAAILSACGFLLLIAVLVASMLLPKA